MDDIQLYVYEWWPSAGGDDKDSPCSECTSMESTYMDKPARPHRRCECLINIKLDVCTLEHREQEEEPDGEPQAQVVGAVQPDSTTNVKYSLSETSGTTSGVGLERGGAKMTTEESRSETESRDVTENVSHNRDVGGGPQVIVNFYQSYKITINEEWHCLIHGTVVNSKTETRREFVGQELFPVGDEPYEMGGAPAHEEEVLDFTPADLGDLFNL